MVKPEPAVGLFQLGSPSHCAAAGGASNANPSVNAARFISASQRLEETVWDQGARSGEDAAKLLQAHGESESDVRTYPEHAVGGSVIELFGVVGDMDPDEAEPEIPPDDPPEVRLVIRRPDGNSRDLVIPDSRRKVRLDAHPRRRERNAQRDGAVDGGLRR